MTIAGPEAATKEICFAHLLGCSLAAAIARCRLLVTDDTGRPMHVADAGSTPMVAIFGPTEWIATPPFGKTRTIVRHEIECSLCLKQARPLGHHDGMKKVGVGQVLRACEEHLKK